MLAVIGGELLGRDERSNWAMLNSLVAANGPESLEVRVLALVTRPSRSIVPGSPLGRTVATLPRWNSIPAETYSPAESARGRVDRALQYLRGLGLRASGDIEPGDPYRAVRREAVRGGYDRVLVLGGDASPLRRLLRLGLAARLRRCLAVPVDAPAHGYVAPPTVAR